MTDIEQGLISILLTVHLCLIKDRAVAMKTQQKGHQGFTESAPPALRSNTRESHYQSSLIIRYCVGRQERGPYIINTLGTGSSVCRPNISLQPWMNGEASGCIVARSSSKALGTKRPPCFQVERASLSANGTPANDLDSLKMSTLSRALKCAIMHLFQSRCHCSEG